MANIVPQGENVIKAHLDHLSDHNEEDLLEEALDYLEEQNIVLNYKVEKTACLATGCPGSQVRDLGAEQSDAESVAQGGNGQGKSEGLTAGPARASELRQWPVQMHLIPPSAPYFKDADVLLAADCTAYAAGDFHKDFLQGKRLTIACPKLDSNQEIYLDKLTALIDQAGIRSLTVMTMEVFK